MGGETLCKPWYMGTLYIQGYKYVRVRSSYPRIHSAVFEHLNGTHSTGTI